MTKTQARTTAEPGVRVRSGRLRIPRTRGAASGLLIVALGLWAALIPFVGPYLDFAFTPAQPWVWTDARGWLEVLPGAVAVLGGGLLIMSANRAIAMLGGWLSVVAGAWLIVGRVFVSMLPMGGASGEVGVPAAATPLKAAVLELAFFSGVGALIVFLGAAALGRLSIRSARDVAHAAHVPAWAPAAAPVHPDPGQPPVADQRTEVLPTAGAHRQRRSWRDVFSGGGGRVAHR